MMVDEQMISLVKAMSGESDTDIVSAFLALSGQAIINRCYPFATADELQIMTIPVRYKSLQCEIAAYLLNKRGAEGETAHNENGINRTYENAGIPESMMKQIVPFCGVIGGAPLENASS